MSVDRDELIQELQSVADSMGRAPMPAELDDRGEYGIGAYRQEFGSWYRAITTAGLEKPPGRKIPDDELLAELTRLRDDLDKTPSEQNMANSGGYGPSTYQKRFGSWNKALEAAGFDPNPDRKHRSREELLRELQDLAEEMGTSPTSRDMKEHGAYSVGAYQNQFGSWNAALKAAGLDPETQGTEIPREALLDELRRVAADTDGVPTTSDMQAIGAYSDRVYRNRFDSWADALEAAGIESSSTDTGNSSTGPVERVRQLTEDLF